MSATGQSDDGDSLRRARDTQLCSVPGWISRSSAASGLRRRWVGRRGGASARWKGNPLRSSWTLLVVDNVTWVFLAEPLCRAPGRAWVGALSGRVVDGRIGKEREDRRRVCSPSAL